VPRRKLRQVPSSLRRLRRGASHDWYARFYGLYETATGKIKRFSFQVRIGSALKRNRRKLAWLMRMTVRALKDRTVPEHTQGEVFSSFRELIFKTSWFKVRRLLDYKAGVIYER
jgi:hypothetical protein